VDPGDERWPPIGGVEADDAGAQSIEGEGGGVKAGEIVVLSQV